MSKVFLYLYPIKEYAETFDLGYNYYDEFDLSRPFDVLNKTIQKRYREKGFRVVFALYPDKEIYGVIPQAGDKIIYTDIPFTKASGYNLDGSEKFDDDITYPNEQFLINQLGDVKELVVGGYHSQDCVKRVAEVALVNGINTLVDLDMTDLFFTLYRQSEYFDLSSYSPETFKNYILCKMKKYNDDLVVKMFNKNYESEVYGFRESNKKQR